MNNCVDIKKCSNCGGCYNVCPTDAISVQDAGLFYTPVIDKGKCIQCGLCAKVCPVNNKSKKQNLISAYGAIHNDEEVLMKSSSGGVFAAIAEEILLSGGVVFGAAYAEDCKAVQMCSTIEKNLTELYRSKYVESIPGYSFRSVKELLESGTAVLYCGAPCQIAGLKSYLRSEYDNLLTCDFSCGGMPSHKIYEQWLAGIEQKLGAEACAVNFRPKTYGWTNHAITVNTKNGKTYKKWAFADPYFDCFLGSHYSVRDFCLECQFANNHYADIILADFWKYLTVSKISNRNKGISLVITNSAKGDTWIQNLSKKLALTVVDLEMASYNMVDKECSNEFLKNRSAFLQRCEQVGFLEAVKGKKLKSSFAFKMKYTAKKILGKE